MRRLPVYLIGGGALAVLVAAVALWRSIGSSELEAITARSAATPREPTGGSDSAPAASSAARPAPHNEPAAVPGTTPIAPSLSREEMEHAPPATRMNTKNLHYGGAQLRTQTAAVEPLVRACVDKAAAAGIKPTGNAVLTFIVAQKPDKVVVEETGIDQDKTSITHEPLLECLRETARGMKFEGLPREAEALIVNRSVKIDNGALIENRLIGFSYIR